MLRFFIKEFSIIFCSVYIFSRVLNITKPKSRYTIFTNLILISLLTGVSVISEYISHANTLTIQIAVSFPLMAIILGIKMEISFISSIISYGISYIIFIISAVLIAIAFGVLHINHDTDLSYGQFIIAIFQFLMVFFLFKIKRLQRGMPFLFQHTNQLILYISVLVLFSYIILSNNNGEVVYVIPVILIFFFGIFLYFSWKNQITNSYLEKLHKRQVNTQLEELKVQSAMIAELENTLDSFSKLVHKDNKLIPSMIMAVKNYLQYVDSHSDIEQYKQKGIALIEELNRISQERQGILSSYEITSQTLNSTNIVSIDALMNYMLQKAKENSIRFELKGSENISILLESTISESDLNTLLADLIENAIIATKECAKRNILVDITMINGIYSVSIFDSGSPFSPKVLMHWGKKRITTHKDTNGSGIGLITTYELLKKCNASFTLEEYETNELFTKKLCVLFDQQNQFTILSPRASTLSETINRPDLIIITP